MTGLEVSDADPCVTCPWRDTNRGKRHPDGWYTRRNLARLWVGLRNGASMSCHPTDPGNVVSPAAQRAGYRPAPPGTQPLECRGGAVLQQREMHLLMHLYDDVRSYRAARPAGLTREGVATLAGRLLLGGVPFLGGARTSRVNLLAAVGYERLSWTADDAASAVAVATQTDPPEGQP